MRKGWWGRNKGVEFFRLLLATWGVDIFGGVQGELAVSLAVQALWAHLRLATLELYWMQILRKHLDLAGCSMFTCMHTYIHTYIHTG